MLSTLVPLLLWLPSGEPAPSHSLAARLAPLAKAHKGQVAIAVKNLQTGEDYHLDADRVMPTASLIKVAVLIETYRQADQGRLKLSDMVTLRSADKVPGSGILTDHFSDGATIPLRDAVHLMIAFSDNTATNLVLDKVGIKAVNHCMEEWGLPNTKINAKVFRGSTTSVDPARTRRYGLGSTTAREMVQLMEDLQLGGRIRPVPKQMILHQLRKNTDKDKFPRFLPAGVVAHKDGSLNEARTDAGLLDTPGGVVAVCVLTNDNQDHSWRPDNAGNLLCARVAKEVYDYFAAQEKKTHPK
jgi:beta-lactamase class A